MESFKSKVQIENILRKHVKGYSVERIRKKKLQDSSEPQKSDSNSCSLHNKRNSINSNNNNVMSFSNNFYKDKNLIEENKYPDKLYKSTNTPLNRNYSESYSNANKSDNNYYKTKKNSNEFCETYSTTNSNHLKYNHQNENIPKNNFMNDQNIINNMNNSSTFTGRNSHSRSKNSFNNNYYNNSCFKENQRSTQELREMKELEECTFRPKINEYYPINSFRDKNINFSNSYNNHSSIGKF